MKVYKQLSLEEREKIYQLQKGGKNGGEIAVLLCRDKGTISRELRRNNSGDLGYLPDSAAVLSKQRKRRNSQIFRSAALRDYITEKLHLGWSPEQISGRMRR